MVKFSALPLYCMIRTRNVWEEGKHLFSRTEVYRRRKLWTCRLVCMWPGSQHLRFGSSRTLWKHI